MPQIYESPDGGQTVYVRDMGSTEKRLYSVSPALKEKITSQLLTQEWLDIKHAAKDNPALQKSINQLIIMYRLIKDGNSKT